MKQFFTMVADLGGFELAETRTPANQMLREFRAGERPFVRFAATVYVHGPNKNYTRLNEPELEQFAASFKGAPFLSDHSRKQSDRGGTIVDSRLEDVGGKKVIRQTIDAVKPWAVEGVLDGTVDRFSIGWNAEEYICTVCGVDFFAEDHKHSIVDVGTKDKKSGETVEVLMKGLEGMETSAVTHPAVPGTSTEGLLAQLTQLKETRASGMSSERISEDTMKEKILSLLGLSADTSEEEALNAFEKRLKAPPSVPATLLTALGLGAEATTDEAVAKAFSMVPREDLEAAEKRVADQAADELVRKGKAAGKITPAMEEWANATARRDAAAFSALLETMPVQIPTAPAPAPTSDPGEKTNTEDEEAARLAGLSVEKFRAGKREFLALVKGGK